MKRFTFNTVCASLLAVTVAVMVAFCCCGLKPQVVAEKNCSHCPSDQTQSKADHKAHECCLAKLVPADLSPAFAGAPSIEKAVSYFTHTVEFVFLPLKSKFNLAYLNGPPFAADVPAYIQFHSLRI